MVDATGVFAIAALGVIALLAGAAATGVLLVAWGVAGLFAGGTAARLLMALGVITLAVVRL